MSDANVGNTAILLVYELNPEAVDFYFIPANSGLNKNLIGAIHKLDGLLVNTNKGPQTELEWKAWHYVQAAITVEAENLDNDNPHNCNRFYAELLPFKIPFGQKGNTFKTPSFTLIRTGTIL